MQLPLTLSFGPSASLQWCLIGGHVLLGMPVVFLLPLWPGLLVLAGLFVLLIWQCKGVRRRRGSLCLREDGQLELVGADGLAARHVLGPHSRVWPHLVVLDLLDGPRLLLLPDAFAAADDHRRLRVWVRWCAREAELTPPDVAE